MGPKSENRLETQTWSAPKGPPQLALTVPGLTILSHPQSQRAANRWQPRATAQQLGLSSIAQVPAKPS